MIDTDEEFREQPAEQSDEQSDGPTEFEWACATFPVADDFIRAATLSKEQDPEGGAAELVTKWKNMQFRLGRLQDGLARKMAEHENDPKFIAEAERLWKAKCFESFEKQKTWLAEWEPPLWMKLRPM